MLSTSVGGVIFSPEGRWSETEENALSNELRDAADNIEGCYTTPLQEHMAGLRRKAQD